MKKNECMRAMPFLFDKWRDDDISKIPLAELSFSDFFDWIECNYSNYIQFRSTMGPREDVELWFDEHTNQLWRR